MNCLEIKKYLLFFISLSNILRGSISILGWLKNIVLNKVSIPDYISIKIAYHNITDIYLLNLKSIHTLDISKCQNITDKGLEYLKILVLK